MIDLLHQIAEERGGRCLSEFCKNIHSLVWWECAKGHRWQATPFRVKLAVNWCPECARGRGQKTIKDMQGAAAERGGRCLSEIYVNSRTRLTWECTHGHQWQALPSSIKNGSWCPHCAGNAKYSIEDMRKLAAERGGRCLSGSYQNGMTKLEWQCSEGHVWEAMPMKIIKGTWCRKCSRSKRKAGSE